MGQRRMRAVVVGTALVVLAGCGSRAAENAGTAEEVPGAPTARGTATAPAATALSWTRAAPIRVVGVRTADGGRSLEVVAEVPDGAGACVRDLRGALESVANGTLYVQVTYETPALDRDSGCTGTRRVETTVKLGEPLGTRTVMVNNLNVYTPAGATPPALRPCDENGCDPTPPRCTSSSYQQAVNDTDIPRHTSWEYRGCDDTWLVLDLSTRMGPVCGEADAGCSSSSVSQRWFYRAETEGWRPVAMNGGAGCAGIHKVLPELPDRLCASLPRLDRG
ncbi:hypothetical protein AB0M64_14340 [Streptomyces sp. NPDC051771]|uniref:hypothetical protein n=1 Tax=Streptomyces sp. NPDC051771 TaxID=3154847 RepID=UPI00341625E5